MSAILNSCMKTMFLVLRNGFWGKMRWKMGWWCSVSFKTKSLFSVVNRQTLLSWVWPCRKQKYYENLEIEKICGSTWDHNIWLPPDNIANCQWVQLWWAMCFLHKYRSWHSCYGPLFMRETDWRSFILRPSCHMLFLNSTMPKRK